MKNSQIMAKTTTPKDKTFGVVVFNRTVYSFFGALLPVFIG
jgi:hypothetical protein